MTSKIKIDVAKIKEERKQFAKKLEQYNVAKAKSKRVNSLIKFDELKKFNALEKIVSESSIPVDEYGDPLGNCILNLDQYQSIFNTTCAYRKTVHRKGQANIKICNILKFNDYCKEERHKLGLNLLYLMSVHPEYTQDCAHILDQWLFEWQPTFLEVCILLENFGCNVRQYLGNHFTPNCYDVALVKAKVDYEEYNTKNSNKYLELNTDCLKNVLVYLKSVIGYFNDNEIQSLLVVLSVLSIDINCVQFNDIFNELVNKCFACLHITSSDKLLNTLYLLFDKTMNQCYYVNKILNPCNSVCEPFAVKLAYLFMCNLLFNYNMAELDTSIKSHSNVSSNTSQSNSTRDTRSKRKLEEPKKQMESHSSPKKQQMEKQNLSLEKENKKLNESTNLRAVIKPPVKGKGRGRMNTVDKTQKSILDYWKVREKSPDLSKMSNSASVSSPKKESADSKLKEFNKGTRTLEDVSKSNQGPTTSLEREDANVPIAQDTCIIDLTEDSQFEIEELFAPNTPCDQLRSLVFAKYKDEVVSFSKLYKLMRRHLHHHLDSPVRVYRIVNLLNCIVKLLCIDESNMDTCKLLMKELSQVQFKYYGLHDMHRHLVCVYLQQYTTVWGTSVNKIQFQIDQRNEEQYSDSD